MAGIRPSHAATGQDRHLPAHLGTCMLVPRRRMIEMVAHDLALPGWHARRLTRLRLTLNLEDLTFAVLDTQRRLFEVCLTEDASHIEVQLSAPLLSAPSLVALLITYRAASSTSHVQRLTSPSRFPGFKEAGTSESEPRAHRIFHRPPGELSETPLLVCLLQRGISLEPPLMLQ